MTGVPKPESETLEKSPSTRTEPSDNHKDTPTLPSHQGDGNGVSRMQTTTDERRPEIKDGVRPQDADPDTKKVTKGRPSFQSEKEATKYYQNKYRDLKSENKRLTTSEAGLAAAKTELAAKNKELHANNSQLHNTNRQIQNENIRLQRALEDERDRNKRFRNENTQLRTENTQLQRVLEEERKRSSAATKKADQLKEQLDDLYRSHIHSVNSINTGLDSISDQNFEEKLNCIHDEVCSWIMYLLPTMHG